MIGPTKVALLSMLMFTLAYMYVPFLDHASDPGAKSAAASVGKFQRLCIKMLDALGIMWDVDAIRFFDTMWMTLKPLQEDPQVEATTDTIEGVGVLIHRPKGVKSNSLLPGLIFLHGGGWVSRSAESYQGLTTYLSKEAKAVIISVNYRLAPEHVFPAAFDDCSKVTEYVLRNAKKYGIERTEIAIAGDGTGGSLAMSVAISLAEEYVDKPYKLRLVGLFYPALQAFDFNFPSYFRHGSGPGPLWKDDVIDNYMYYLFGRKDAHIRSHLKDNLHTSPELKHKYMLLFDIENLPYSFRGVSTPSPALHTGNETLSNELHGLFLDTRVSPMLLKEDAMDILPRTFLVAAEFDPLRDESFLLYAAIRSEDMDKAEHLYYRSEQHGFLEEFKDNAEARDAISKFIKHFNTVLRVGTNFS